jgi:hypothetical protein
MAKGSGGTRGAAGGGSARRGNFDPDYNDVNTVAKQLMNDLNISPYDMHFNFNSDDNATAAGIVEDVAKGNYGFASEVAKTVADRKPGNRINWTYGVSEKQAYVIAKAATEHGHVPMKPQYSKSKHEEWSRPSLKDSKKANKYAAYAASYTKSSTKVATGSRVFDAKHGWGTIGKIITKSTGYVSVNFDSGKTTGAMAFNLKGEDGNFLKKRPK